MDNNSNMISEIRFQSDLFTWCWNYLPQTRYCLFHVPNGGKRSKIEAMQLKSSGVIAGVPDLLLVWKGRVHAFELKTPIGVLSDAQKNKVHPAWLNQGVKVHIVRDLETFKKIISDIVL